MKPLDFVAKYRSLFGMARRDDDPVFTEWVAQLIRLDVPADVLAEAWDDVARTTPANVFPGERWPRVLDAIRGVGRRRAQATERARREAEIEGSDKGRCAVCDGHGNVAVPHPKFVSGGEWASREGQGGVPKFPTIVVCCDCPIGTRLFNRARESAYPLPHLGTYREKVAVGWKRLLQEAEDIKRGHWSIVEKTAAAVKAAKAEPVPPRLALPVQQVVRQAQLPPDARPALPPPRKPVQVPF